MNRAERYAQIKALRDVGMEFAQIARQLGLAKQTVHDVWYDPEGKKAKARRRRNMDKKVAANAARRAALEPDPVPGLLWIKDIRGNVVGETKVDLEDWFRFRHLSLSLRARAYVGVQVDGKQTYLHRLILGLPPGGGHQRQADHINRDPFDNRRANLRIVTPRENCANRGGMYEGAELRPEITEVDVVAHIRSRTCPGCGENISHRRLTAKTCGGACRKRMARALAAA